MTFATCQVEDLKNSPLAFSHLRFSMDGKLLLAVAEWRIYVLDAFSGEAPEAWCLCKVLGD